MLVVAVNAQSLAAQSLGAQSLESGGRALPRIDVGTPVDNNTADRWNRTVLLSRPKLDSGDVDALSSSIRDSAASLIVTFLATIEATQDQTGEAKYRLAEVGVGTSAEIDGELKVVTLAAASQLGLSVGLIKRQLLYENERQFRHLRLVAQTSTLAIFDVPAIVLRDGEHRDFIMRHLVWINSRTGASATLIWLLALDAEGGRTVADEAARWLPPGFREDRKIHIDRREFTLGIPGKRAFALVDLPPGQAVPWTPAAKALAGLPRYSMQQLKQFAAAMNAALRASE